MLLDQAIATFRDYMIMIDRSQSTVTGYTRELAKLNEFLQQKHNGLVYLEDIVLQDLEDFMLREKEKGLSSASRSSTLYTLRSFYNYACKKELCKKNFAVLLEPIKVQQKERDYLTEQEFEELTQAIKQPVVRTMVKTMFYTGGRITEMVKLKMEDVDLDKNVLHIIKGKGNKDRDIPISLKLHQILVHYLKHIRQPEKPTDRFFTTVTTGQVSNNYVNECIRDGVRKLGWKRDISAHVLRHSFSSNLLAKGASVVSIQKLLGHSSLAVTTRYLHQDQDTLSAAVNLL
ncbi:MAG: tyrosine-type recombinase/integrase [Syntrophomonadaceae bacterium]|jgi:integrase/recombinase XerD